MKNLTNNLATLLTVAWVGGLWTTGYLVAPALFQALPNDKMLAGLLAGKVFAAIAYLGMTSALYLLLYSLRQHGTAAFKQTSVRLVLAMLLLTLIGHCGLQPMMQELKALVAPLDVMHSDQAGRFKALHGVASVLYLIQSGLGGWLVLRRLKADR